MSVYSFCKRCRIIPIGKLDDLKKELRRRKVKVSGKKAALVERLTYLDSVGRRGTEPEPGLSNC